MSRRYPKGYAVLLKQPAWVDQADAARELGVSMWRIGVLIANDHLQTAETSDLRMGVSRASLDAEAAWRAGAGIGGRVSRLGRDAINWI